MAGIELPTEATMMGQELNELILGLYGPPGVGKTTFANGLGNVLFLSTDRGTRNLLAKRIEIPSWKRALKVLTALEKSEVKYDYIAIDHVSDWANMAEDSVCDDLGVDSLSDESLAWGKGWKTFKNELRSFIGRILALDTGVIFVAQEQVKKIENRAIKVDRTQPDLGKTAWNILVPICDIIGYCGIKNVKIKGGGREERRYLSTEPTETMYAKDRSRRQRPGKGELEPLDPTKFLESFGDLNHGKERNKGTRQEEQEGRRGRRGRRAG